MLQKTFALSSSRLTLILPLHYIGFVFPAARGYIMNFAMNFFEGGESV